MVEAGEIFQVGNTRLELVNFFKPKEVFIEGREMIRRAIALHANLGSHYVKVVLDHSNKIPKSYDEYDLVFAGARLKKRVSFECTDYEFIAYLRKVRGCWFLGYGNIDFDWDMRARLIRPFLFF